MFAGGKKNKPRSSCSVWLSEAQTEFKRVAEENVTLPCHHRLGLLEQGNLDIEWLLHISETVQKAVITYSGGRVYDDLNEEQKGRVSFTSNFLAGDASLQIISLQSSDAGKYICKVKNAGQYEWARITLKVVDAQNVGMIAGAVCGVVLGLSLLFLVVRLTIRRKEKKRYEEEEAPNEIR
ncbi:hypothetical protein llap_19254 [Limosa lapponica baueri]|uniref:Ig-like domain-containing protein n=1 Tax=Limosa lapponica baueri TaxID=1758121 RepID=A0A2I0T9E9_LIMLA|nr:hypothetical protein llap_19254 [Limosa lapponica baueri]